MTEHANILSHEDIKSVPVVSSEHEGTKFHRRVDSSLFPSNQPLWTPQCRLLLVDNLTQPLPG